MKPTNPISRNRWWTRVFATCLLTAACTNGFAADVNLVGIFPGKALLSIDGGAPKTISTGQKTAEGVTLVAVSSDAATVEIDGKRRVLRLGQAFRSTAASADADTIVLSPDARGHYVTSGAINGKPARFLVDTGATTVAFGTNLANQFGIPYRNGRQVTYRTANGPSPAYVVMLESVRIDGITLHQVEAAISDGMNQADGVLLGMSFIGRLSMQRDGQTMRLSRRAGVPAGRQSAGDARDKVTLAKTAGGMFMVSAKINGLPLPFVVDTGATMVSIDAAQAQSLGLNYQQGTPAWSSTANGRVRTWIVKIDSIAVGPITLYGIDASVREGPGTGGTGLLGISFLNRVEMQRDGDSLTLTKRF